MFTSKDMPDALCFQYHADLGEKIQGAVLRLSEKQKEIALILNHVHIADLVVAYLFRLVSRRNGSVSY